MIGYRERVTDIDPSAPQGESVDATLAELAAIAADLDAHIDFDGELPAAAVADRLEAVHAGLQGALAELDRA